MENNTTLTIRLSAELAKHLKRIGHDEMCGTSEAVRLLLARAVQTYAEDSARLPRIAAKAKNKARDRAELVERLKRDGQAEIAAQVERAEARRMKRVRRTETYSWDR